MSFTALYMRLFTKAVTTGAKRTYRLPMKTIALITTLLLSSSAFADFAGHWITHNGSITDIQGKKTSCSKIEITMSQVGTKLTTETYSSVCGIMTSDWGPDPMTIQDGKVLNLDGDEIGTLQDNTLQTEEPISSVLYRFDLTLAPATAEQPADKMHSVYGVKNFLGTMSIEGDLERVP
jgi:hypothetical protein